MIKRSRFWVYSLSILATLLTIVSSCKKDENTDDNQQTPPPTPTVIKNTYSGSGSYGDLVTFEFNQTALSYSTYNETTGQSSSGNYTVLGGPLQGVYRVLAAQDTFFAVELNDKFIAANFPTGNPQNNLSMGICSEIDNSNNMTNIAGNYVFIEIDAQGFYNNGNYKEWGAVTVYPNGVFEGMSYATGGPYPLHETTAPEDWTYGFPLVQDSIEFDGTFTINPTNKERLTVALNNAPGADFNGFVYATPTEGVLILDEGAGNGFMLCVKVNPASTLASVAGAYKYISVFNNNTPVGGNATISSSGSGTYTQMLPSGAMESGTLTNIQQCPHIPNFYHGDMYSTQFDGKFYVCIVGDIFFKISFNTDGTFGQYGAGGKLN